MDLSLPSLANRSFYADIDRSRLGFYGVGHMLLWLGANAEISNWGEGTSWIATKKEAGFYHPDQKLFLSKLSESGKERMQVAAELLYWWQQFPEVAGKASKTLLPYVDVKYTIRIQNVISRPELHEYFKAGVWDLFVAERSFKADVDPSLIGALV